MCDCGGSLRSDFSHESIVVAMLKRIAIGLGVLLGLVGIGIVAVLLVGSSNVARTYDVPALAQLAVTGDSAQVARGAHLANIYGCNDCHGENFAGNVMEDAPPFRIVAANLTPGAGGIGSRYTIEDWDRTIRHGVKPDGRAVIVMPSAAFHSVGDADMAALIAYLQTLEPVDNELPTTTFKPLGRILAAGPMKAMLDFEVRSEPARSEMPTPGPTVEYGAYLAGVCAYCHGENLEGMMEPPGPPGMIPAPGLMAAGRWSFEEFETAVRTGVRPNGKEINATFMPLALTQHMSDQELQALHAYFGTITQSEVASGTDV